MFKFILAAFAALTLVSGAQAQVGSKLDTTTLSRLMFQDTFRLAPKIDETCSLTATTAYQVQYCGQGDPNTIGPRTHGGYEHECFSSPVYDGYNPFSLNKSGGLDINAIAMTPAAAKVCPAGTKYLSGMLTTFTRYSFTTGYAYVKMQVPPCGHGHWPALWLLERNTKSPGIWPPELDVSEFAANCWNASQHSVAHPDGVGPLYPNLGQPTGVHEYGILITPTMLKWYIDQVEVYEHAPDPGVVGVPYYMILDFSISGGPTSWTGVEDSQTVPATLHVAEWGVYGLK